MINVKKHIITKMVKCDNLDCFYSESGISVPCETGNLTCPLCGSSMSYDNSKEWLESIALDESLWLSDVITGFPSVIAYEYQRLRNLCMEHQAYGVLMCLKDNFESILKLETLLAFSWSVSVMDKTFINKTVSQLTIQNPSLGTWVEFARIIIKDLKKEKIVLPSAISLEEVYVFFTKSHIVNWRNKKIGHGAMELEEDEEFRDDIRQKINLLLELYKTISPKMMQQQLMLFPNGNTEEDAIPLTGVDRARNLNIDGVVFFKSNQDNVFFITEPFIVIRRQDETSYGVFFFDNQCEIELSHFQSYIDGKHISENIPFFERLRRKLAHQRIRVDSLVDDEYLTAEESNQIDLVQINDFICPEHLISWLRECMSKNEKGVFWLKMERGMGKSVFSEKLNRLFSKPICVLDDLDVRTYHFNRTQLAGNEDFYSYLEWMWGNEFGGKAWPRIPHINDYVHDGLSAAEALSEFLKSVRQYSARNRDYDRVLMVLDGLDEITEDSLWESIPNTDQLYKGTYILVTSRIPGVERLPRAIEKRLGMIDAIDCYSSERTEISNKRFLYNFIQQKSLKKLDDSNKDKIIKLADYRILELTMLCKLALNGMPIDSLPDNNEVVKRYLNCIYNSYGERESIVAREILVLLSTLAVLEPMSLENICFLLSQNGISLKYVGIMRDLSPLLKIVRRTGGNAYQISNPGIAHFLSKILEGVEDMIRFLIGFALSWMSNDSHKDSVSMQMLCAHVVELSIRWLPERTEIFGNTGETIFSDFIDRKQSEASSYSELRRVADYYSQLYMLQKEQLGEDNDNTIKTMEDCANAFYDAGKIEMYLSYYEMAYKVRSKTNGFGDKLTIKLMLGVSKGLEHLGRIIDARQWSDDAYEKYRLYFKQGDPIEIDILINKASIEMRTSYALEGVEIAEQLLKEAYKNYYKYGIDNKLKLALILGNWSTALGILGYYADALDKAQEGYKLCVEVSGEEGKEAIIDMPNIAYFLWKLNQKEESIALLEKAYNMTAHMYGKDHPIALDVLFELAHKWHATGELEKACEGYQLVYEMRCTVLTEDHLDTITAQEYLYDSLLEMQHYKECAEIAKDLYEKQCRMAKEKQGAVDKTLEGYHFEKQFGRPMTSWLDKYYFENLGLDDPVRIALNRYIKALTHMGIDEDYIQETRKKMKNAISEFGEKHPAAISTMRFMATVLECRGYYEDAIIIREKVYSICNEMYDVGSDENIMATEELVTAYNLR